MIADLAQARQQIDAIYTDPLDIVQSAAIDGVCVRRTHPASLHDETFISVRTP